MTPELERLLKELEAKDGPPIHTRPIIAALREAVKALEECREVLSLRARIAELEADRDDLNWLEQHYLCIDETTCRESKHGGILGVTFNTSSATLREAVRAARKESE